MAYEENVRKIAEEMAKDFAGEDVTPSEADYSHARISVRKQSEAVIIYAFGSIKDYEDLKAGGYAGDFEKELIGRGLVPAPETLVVDKDCTISVLERFCGKENVITQPGGSTKIKTANGIVRIDQDYVITKSAQGLLIHSPLNEKK